MIVRYSTGFDRMLEKLPEHIQEGGRNVIASFLERFVGKEFPKGLRVHRCGPFISLSIDPDYRIYLKPIPGGICFVFIGNHRDADRYLKKI